MISYWSAEGREGGREGARVRCVGGRQYRGWREGGEGVGMQWGKGEKERDDNIIEGDCFFLCLSHPPL